MRIISRRYLNPLCRLVILLLIISLAPGCAFLPGFGILEDPLLYVLPIGTVANQVACELQDFMRQQNSYPSSAKRRWLLSNDDAKVTLSLTTDTSGYVNFTGVNVAALGFASLASFISKSSSVSTLALKVSAKRTRTVVVSFSVSPNTLPKNMVQIVEDDKQKVVALNCKNNLYARNPIESLYLRDWLTNYFDTINGVEYDPWSKTPTDYITNAVRTVWREEQIPEQFKIQSVELSTAILVAADVSGGATPNLLGNGSVFILPINGLSLDYNPDYTHKIDITLTMCDTKDKSAACTGKQPTKYDPILDQQCQIYAWLSPILTGVKAPRDYQIGATQCRCGKDGKYRAHSGPDSCIRPTANQSIPNP